MTISKTEQVIEVIDRIGFPLVFKPLDGNHGRGISININTTEDAIAAYEFAAKISRRVIVERFVTGYDFRVLVIDNKMVAAALRDPAHIKGDGELNIQELIDKENTDPRRGYGHENVLTLIDVDRDTLRPAGKERLYFRNRSGKGEKVFVKSTANLSTGGTSVDVTDHVHPKIFLSASAFPRSSAWISAASILWPRTLPSRLPKTAVWYWKLTPPPASGCILPQAKVCRATWPAMLLICFTLLVNRHGSQLLPSRVLTVKPPPPV
jgi:hypothetical protein